MCNLSLSEYILSSSSSAVACGSEDDEYYFFPFFPFLNICTVWAATQNICGNHCVVLVGIKTPSYLFSVVGLKKSVLLLLHYPRDGNACVSSTLMERPPRPPRPPSRRPPSRRPPSRRPPSRRPPRLPPRLPPRPRPLGPRLSSSD